MTIILRPLTRRRHQVRHSMPHQPRRGWNLRPRLSQHRRQSHQRQKSVSRLKNPQTLMRLNHCQDLFSKEVQIKWTRRISKEVQIKWTRLISKEVQIKWTRLTKTRIRTPESAQTIRIRIPKSRLTLQVFPTVTTSASPFLASPGLQPRTPR